MSTVLHPPPSRMIRPARGRSKLPVVELDRTAVTTPYRRIVKSNGQWPPAPEAIATTSVGHATHELPMEAWPFFHAAAKTELACDFTEADVVLGAFGFQLSTETLLLWKTDNLRLRDGGVFSRKDASRTAYACRCGEATAHLLMQQQHYVFWDHLPALVERAMNKARLPHPEQTRVAKAIKSRMPRKGDLAKQPDYAFENRAGEVALAEAKGAFIPPDSNPRMIKGDLSYGLKQLTVWQDCIRPRPTKSFAIGTYLREASDPFPDPSLIAFVDPEGDDTPPFGEPVPIPNDWIRRGNYGAWLIGMGFTNTGVALRNAQVAEVQPRELPVLSIGRRAFAVVPYSAPNPLWFDFFPDPFFHRWHRLFPTAGHIPLLGIEVDNLRRIEQAIVAADSTLPLDMAMEPPVAEVFPEWLSGSVFPDGTLFGTLHIDRRTSPRWDAATFKL